MRNSQLGFETAGDSSKLASLRCVFCRYWHPMVKQVVIVFVLDGTHIPYWFINRVSLLRLHIDPSVATWLAITVSATLPPVPRRRTLRLAEGHSSSRNASKGDRDTALKRAFSFTLNFPGRFVVVLWVCCQSVKKRTVIMISSFLPKHFRWFAP